MLAPPRSTKGVSRFQMPGTLCLITPDAVAAGHAPAIEKRLAEDNFAVLARLEARARPPRAARAPCRRPAHPALSP